MATKTKTRINQQVLLRWDWNIYQGAKTGTLIPPGLVHESPPIPVIANGVVHLSAQGAAHGGQLLVEMTGDQGAVSPWHLVDTENFNGDGAELVCQVPERVQPHEYADQPRFIRCRYSASPPPVDPWRVANERGYTPPTLEPHTVLVTLEYEEQSAGRSRAWKNWRPPSRWRPSDTPRLRISRSSSRVRMRTA